MSALDRPAWQADAACHGLRDVVDFFPERGRSVRPAKAICAECPVRVECLDYAIANGIHHGIWGGLSERERRKVRRERNVVVPRTRLVDHGTNAGYTAHLRRDEKPCRICLDAAAAYQAVAKSQRKLRASA